MSAVNTWNEFKAALSAQLNADRNLEHTAGLVRQAIERVQHQTMSEQKDTVLRQQVGILFSYTKTSCEILSAVGSPKLWISEVERKKTAKFRLDILLIIAFAALICIAGVLCYLEKDILEVGLLAGAALCVFSVAIIQGRGRRKAEKPKQDFKIDLHADPDRIIAFLDKQMQLIDKHIDEMNYLNQQRSLQKEEVSSELLEVCSQLLEAKRSENQELVSQSLSAAEHYLKRIGVEIIEYSPQTERYFKVLPAKRGERTITPAFIKEGKLLRAGLAAVGSEQ